MNRPRTLTCLTVVLVMPLTLTRELSSSGSVEDAAPLTGRWEKLPLPPPCRHGVSDMVVEPGGTLWVKADNSLFYWDGNEFRCPLSSEILSGAYRTRLHGGPDRGIYATQRLLEKARTRHKPSHGAVQFT